AFSLIASGQAGYAISYGLGQGATMIAVIWGVFIWREFASAPAGTNKLLLTMFICKRRLSTVWQILKFLRE
ncbi:hypothetical protein ACSLPA_31895, partial [Escherichia coli]